MSAIAARVIGARAHQYLFFLYQFYIRGGWRRVWRYQHDAQSGKGDFLAICAIIKNEGPYLREWIEFHRLVGVQRFYLYLNDCSDNTFEVLRPYLEEGLVETVEFNGDKMQIPAYDDCIERHFRDVEWLAFIDLDEFIVPQAGRSLVEYLSSLKASCRQVLLKWLFFGSNGQERRESGLVIERFTRRGGWQGEWWQTKGIVRPRFVYEIGVHQHRVAGKTTVADMTEFRIHHYFCKSWEEYALRAPRGDVFWGNDRGCVKYSREFFNSRDLNDVEDLSALEFLPEVRQALA